MWHIKRQDKLMSMIKQQNSSDADNYKFLLATYRKKDIQGFRFEIITANLIYFPIRYVILIELQKSKGHGHVKITSSVILPLQCSYFWKLLMQIIDSLHILLKTRQNSDVNGFHTTWSILTLNNIDPCCTWYTFMYIKRGGFMCHLTSKSLDKLIFTVTGIVWPNLRQ